MRKQKQIQDGFVPALTVSPNGYGFGQDWTLIISQVAAGQIQKVRRFWLGQDAKVCARIMGQRISDVRPYRIVRHINKPATLAIKANIVNQVIDAYGGDSERLFKEAQDWDLAAE